jgi:hypothetical protein
MPRCHISLGIEIVLVDLRQMHGPVRDAHAMLDHEARQTAAINEDDRLRNVPFEITRLTGKN